MGSSSGESGDDGGTLHTTVPFKSLVTVQAAPEVDTTGMALIDAQAVTSGQAHHIPDVRARQVYYNVPFEDMHAPAVGPAHPFNKDGLAAGMRNHRAGHVEDSHVHSFHFDDQYYTYHSFGHAMAPGGGQRVSDPRFLEEQQIGESVYTVTDRSKKRKTADKKAAAAKAAEAAACVDPSEPWAVHNRQPWADKEVKPAELNDEQKAFLEQVAKDKADAAEVAGETPTDKSMFHGKSLKDYAGRSWLEAPKDLKAENEHCFLPKRWVHTWSGHTKGVNAIRFFPKTGHLLLSAGLDGKIKMWDVNGSGKCMRTYMGFTKGVKDINFSNDGKRFLSTSYDKVIKLWDTETGQVIKTFGENKMFYVAKFHPEQQNMMLAGCSDKKVYQWDLESGDIIQEYDYHLAAVNTITFVDEGRRFVTTSDDKTIRVWDLGVPVQIKYMADPGMHSMPAVTLSPDQKWFVGTSLDNKIDTYSTKDRFRQNRKKTFKGHVVAGYACRPNFSLDGRYVMSGDGEGKCWFWEWQNTKVARTIKAHEGVCIDCEWHPLESSKVATCGWDGAIKYW
ncbi:MAG: pre-mRNA-processing factor 17-like [Trebouxia sp. A1-2]|nr:MAG: pre-mRNA-processing factor 17-like [Trebouxia sp. A1-2]